MKSSKKKSTDKKELSQHIFLTKHGFAAIVFKNKKIVGFLLPQKNKTDLKKELKKSFDGSIESKEVIAGSFSIVSKIKSYFEGSEISFSEFNFCFDDYTAFQKDILKALIKVKYGETISYKMLAQKAGHDKAVRAVGGAVGANKIPLLIPCHRVINSDGSLGGFSAAGGVEQKAALLRLEKNILSESPVLALQAPLLLKDISIQEAQKHLIKVEPAFKTIIELYPEFGLKVNSARSLFEQLLETIIHQQVTGKAAQTIHERLLLSFSGQVSPLDLIRADEDELRAVGLSGPKIAALKDLADFALQKKIPSKKQLLSMPNQEIIDRLTKIRGIGRWSVEMMLMFALGRADVMAKDDFGLKKGLAKMKKMDELPTPSELQRQSEKWKPYRSVAAWYLWRAAETKLPFKE